MTAAAAYAQLEVDDRFAGYSSTARALCAIAWVGGAALRPGSVLEDAEVLVVAELLVHHGYDPGEALVRARRGTITDAHLRGAIRYASSRHARNQLRPALLERGLRSVRELSRPTAVELATWLFAWPADKPDEKVTIAAALELCRREDPEPEGPVLGGCMRCGAEVCEAGATIGIWYFIPGRRRPGSEERTADRFEWRTFSPLVELGWPDEKVLERRREQLPEIVKQAREGAHLLCRSCAGRAHLGLIDWPPAPEEELDELEAGSPWRRRNEQKQAAASAPPETREEA